MLRSSAATLAVLNTPLREGEHTLWRLLRSHAAIACPRHRDAAPLRLVSWMSCEPPAHIEALLHQLMLLFAEVQPVDSEQVISAARRALDLPEKPQVSWDDIRDAIINGLVVGGNSSPPPEVTGLLSGFLRRLALPRLVHFLDMILPQMVPVKSPCRTSARRFSSSYLMEERSRNSYYAADLDCKVCHLHWSRAGVARVFIDWNQQPVLLLATRLLANRDAKFFQYGKGAAYDRQQIQMGFRKGNTVLIHYRRGSDLYQSVLIMQDADLKQGKVSPEQHKYWRYVAPVRSYFDWLPEKIATTFCSIALEAFPGRKHGELEHLEEMDNPRYASMCFQNIYHIGDTKSGQELEVFLTMPLERLRLGCGIQCTETMLPLGPNQRPRLYAAALKLLRFALRLDQVRFCSEVEEKPCAPFSNYKMNMC